MNPTSPFQQPTEEAHPILWAPQPADKPQEKPTNETKLNLCTDEGSRAQRGCVPCSKSRSPVGHRQMTREGVWLAESHSIPVVRIKKIRPKKTLRLLPP